MLRVKFERMHSEPVLERRVVTMRALGVFANRI